MEDQLRGKSDFGSTVSEIMFSISREVLRERVSELLDPESIENMISDIYSGAPRFFFSYADDTGNIRLATIVASEFSSVLKNGGRFIMIRRNSDGAVHVTGNSLPEKKRIAGGIHRDGKLILNPSQ